MGGGGDIQHSKSSVPNNKNMDTFISLVNDWICGVSKEILILKNYLLYLISFIKCLVVSDCSRTSSIPVTLKMLSFFSFSSSAKFSQTFTQLHYLLKDD